MALIVLLATLIAPDALILTSAAAHQIDPDVLYAVLWHESRLDPQARNLRTGALGIAQFTAGGRRAVSRLTGRLFTARDAMNPRQAIPAAAILLRHLLDRCRTMPRALRGWHTGRCGPPRGWERRVLREARRRASTAPAVS